MTAAAEHVDVLTILRRAEQRWCQRNADESRGTGYLELLAEAVRAHLAASDVDAAPSNSDVLDGAQRDAVRAVGALEATRRERDHARDERDRALAEVVELTKTVGHLTKQVGLAEAHKAAEKWHAEYDRAVDDAIAGIEHAEQHHHRYGWPAPDEPIQPCSCGKPWPRYGLNGGEDVEPDQEPFDDLMARVRDELAGWGTPPRNRKGAAR